MKGFDKEMEIWRRYDESRGSYLSPVPSIMIGLLKEKAKERDNKPRLKLSLVDYINWEADNN